MRTPPAHGASGGPEEAAAEPWVEDVDLTGLAPALIEVRGLVKRFGDRTVLDGLDLTVERGETVVIIGGLGSGKTTFARLLVGLDRPTAGRIVVDGTDLTRLGDRALTEFRRRFAVVFQRGALLDSMSVFDNVAFPLREETDLDEEAIAARVMAALDELGIEAASRKLPAELSGGMAKRVGIARAIVLEPRSWCTTSPPRAWIPSPPAPSTASSRGCGRSTW